MAEDDALPANAVAVSVMHMVDPSTFWVTEPPGQDMTKEREELNYLEEMLSGHYRRSSYNIQGVNYMPEEGELVAVQHPETGRWHRAEVECILHVTNGYVYKVFLVDHGLPVKVRSSVIRRLPLEWNNLDYQAFQVVLYGILPTTVEMDYQDMKMKREVASNWTAAAVRFVKRKLEESTKLWLVYHKNVKKKIYGDLFVELSNEIVNLSQELCSQEYAVRSEELFEKALIKSDTQQEKLFCKTSSPQSPVCTDSRNQSSSPMPSLSNKNEPRRIQDYIRECSVQQAKIGEKRRNQIDKWRREVEAASVDTHENAEYFQSDDEESHGRGMSLVRRKEISPGVHSKLTLTNVEKVGKWNESSNLEKWNESSNLEASHEHEIKASPMLGLLDLIDRHSDHDSNSISELNNTLSTEYIPAGANLVTNNKMSKNQRGINSASLTNKGRSFVDVRNDSHSLSFKNTKKYDSVSDIFPQSTSVSSDTERNEVQSSVVIHSEHSEQIGVKKQQRPLSLLECLQAKTNSVIKNSNSRPENGGGTQCDITEKSITSVSTRSIIQDIVNSMEKTTQSKRQDLLDDLKKNFQSPSSIPDMTTRLPQAALKAMLKRETSGNDTQMKPVNSLASEQTLPSVQIPTLSAGFKIADRLRTSRILVHGDVGFRTIQSIGEANFPWEIHQALAKMDFKDPMRIQIYAWPAIMRGQYTVLVGPPRSGKTVAYIIPLVSFMLTPDVYSELPPGNGPLVLVLCSGSKSAQFVYEKCCTLLELSSQDNVRVEIAYGGGRERELRDPLANGCDILISTPRCFMRLLRCSRIITNVDRLAHLVLDEVDILAQKFLSELKGVITECKQMLDRRGKVGVPVQVIAASAKWCPAVEQFSQHISQNFLVCISGYLEAAVYAKLKPTLHFLSASRKPHALLDILDGYQGLYKTVIVCQSVAEVSELVPVLKSQCYQVLAAHEDMTQWQNSEVCHRWKCSVVPGVHPVLVCTDDVLPDLDVSDAMWLIHYSLPHTKTGFGFRFSCLMDNYNNMFQKSTCKDDSPDCKVHIFADKDQTTRELPEVLCFLKRLSVPIAPDIEAKAMEIVRQKESQKHSFPLCYYLKAFGECLERTVCRSRHIIMDSVDRPSGIPTCGVVKVKILHVHDASSFSARLLEHTNVDGCTTSIPDEYLAVNMAVYTHYSDERNRRLHGVPKLGDVCSLESKINFFQRVQVVEVVKEDSKGIPEELKVKFLDEGTCSVIKVYQLLALPEDLQRLSPQVVDIFLCNVMPCDLDTGWSETANCRMNDWISNINSGEEEGKFIVGKVVLSAGHTLWLDPLECRSYLSSMGTHVLELSLTKELVKCRLAVNNPSHLNKLYELCHAGGLSVPSYEKVPALKKVQPKIQRLPSPQWAHLDTEIFQEVVIVCADNPHQLFIRHYKFSDSFKRFINELQKCVKTKPEDFHLEKGSYCLGKFPDDGLWYRARVDQLLEGDRALLFFVDHGDNASVSIDDIAPITEMLIKKLPFQAIECSLAGVKPPDEGTWSDEATDVVYEFNDNSNGLFCKVCDVMKTAVCTGGKKYKVVLVDTSTDVDVYLNRVLLERNLALADSIEQIFDNLDLVRTERANSSEESDVDTEESQIIDLSDISMSQHPKTNAIMPSAEESILDTSDDEGYDIVIDDIQKYLMNMMGLNTNCEPSMPTLPALPSSHDHSTKSDSAAHISSHCSSSDDEDNGTNYIPPLVRTTRTPQVLWHQDECTIYLKIMITGVQKYHIKWNVTHLQFSTEVNSQVYEVTLDLYGPVNASSITHTAMGFFVHIKMMKTVIGSHWPRLLCSQYKQLWLKLDLEKYKGDFESEEKNVEALCNKARRELSLSNKEVQNATTNLRAGAVISGIPVSSSDDDDDDSDVLEPQNETYDPYDPLN